MGLLAIGQVVTVPFPYTDLSGRKPRPALVLAAAGYNDWIIAQITSNPYSDPFAVELSTSHFLRGGLPHTSFVRPSKLFTANESLAIDTLGFVTANVLTQVRQNVISILSQP
jgi:mRNA interferase MazF